MGRQSLVKFFKSLKHTIRDSVVDSISSAVGLIEDEENNEENRFKDFSEDMIDVIENTFDEDFDNYSKESLKINMMMRGYDDDETFRYVNTIKDKCVENRIGIIDIKKPIELGNLAIALLEV